MTPDPASDARPDLTPIVRALLQALAGTLRQAEAFSGLVEAIYREAEGALLPAGLPATLSFGMSYTSWVEHFSAQGRASTTGGIRNAFSKILNALTRAGVTDALSVALRVDGVDVVGHLRIVRPAAKNVPAGVEIDVTWGRERHALPLSRVPERKRVRARTASETEAALLVKLVKNTVSRNEPLGTTLIEEYADNPVTPRKLLLETGRGRRFVFAKLPRYVALVVLLGLAGALAASPELRGFVKEAAAAAWAFVTGTKAPHPTRPVPTPTPYPTPSAVLSFAPPPRVKVPGLVLNLTSDRLHGDVPSVDSFTMNLGLQPLLYLASDTTCSRCVFLLAYPALTDDRPLVYRVAFGDGVTEILKTVTAFTPGSLNLRRRGLYHLTEPEWLTTALFAQTWHQYPDVDATYVIHVVVEAVNPSGPATTLVTLERLVRIEPRGVVSTDATITVPTPTLKTP